MNKFIKDSLILCLITLIAGLLLGAVYEITADARAKQKEETKLNAYKKVYATADDFKEIEIDKNIYGEELKSNGLTSKNVVIDGVVEALSKEGKLLGYIINVTSKEGFAGDISYAVGIDKELKIKGVSMLAIGETAGLGMNASKEEFLNNYTVDRTGLFVVNKEDGVWGTNIDAISGATITTKAVTNGVNAAIIVAEKLINGDAQIETTIKEVQ